MVSSYASAAGLTKLTKEIEDYKPVTQKRLNESKPQRLVATQRELRRLDVQ